MFERYTEKARRVIFFARYETSHLGGTEIEPEHLLLGIMRESTSLLHSPRVKVTAPDDFRQRVTQATPFRSAFSTSVDLPLSEASRSILSYAAEEADALQHRFIGTEHLLLGVFREKKSLAAQWLTEQGHTADALRDKLRRSGLVDGQPPAGPSTPDNGPSSLVNLPFSPESLHAVAFALDEALKEHRQYIGTEHLLLGLVRQENSLAAKLLATHGLTAETLLAELDCERASDS